MQSDPFSSTSVLLTENPTAALGRHLRWQVVLTFAGLFVLITLLGYSTYSVTTVLVPERGGIFREGVAGNPQYLNPFFCDSSPVDQDLCALLYRGLTRIDKQGRVVADLADTWTVTDNRIYTFRLKPEQFWHDGQPVTADDVLFTIGILQDPNALNLLGLTQYWRQVTVEKVDEMTVRFTLTQPKASFLDLTAIGLLPKHLLQNIPAAELTAKAINRIPVGTGPLLVKEMAADHIRLEPSPFAAGNSPYLSALDFRFYPDHPSLLTAFNNGEIDGISSVLPGDLAVAQQRDDLQLLSTEQSGYLIIFLNLDNPNDPFFQEKNVRQALYYGLDRQGLADSVLGGQGIVAHSILLPESWAYNPDVPRYEYAPAKATALLDAAGWVDSDNNGIRDKNGKQFEFLLHTSENGTNVALIQRIAADWEKIGVHALPTPATFVGLVGDLLTPRRFDAAMVAFATPGDPDPTALWHSSQSEGGGENYAVWKNLEADDLMQKALATTNEEERRKFYWRFQDLFAEEAPSLLLYYPVYTYGVNKRIHNVQIGSLNQPSERFANFADWYLVTRRVPANQVPKSVPPTPPSTAP